MERRGIKLPATLLKELDISSTGDRSIRSRKDRKAIRKADRIQKKQQHKKQPFKRVAQPVKRPIEEDSKAENISPSPPPVVAKVKGSDKPRQVRKKVASPIAEEPPKVSRRVREKLDEDDAEILALERRLGIKSKRLPKSFEDDGLGDLLGDLDGSGLEDDDEPRSKKVKISKEEEEWLQHKRQTAIEGRHVQDESDEDPSNDDLEDDLDDENSDDFEGFGDENDTETEIVIPQTRTREDPYTAPISSPGAKYIPPSLRKPVGNEEALLQQLKRQIQGTLNRLSEAKVLSIASDVEQIYRENPRQHVSTLLLDVLFALICDPAPLQDTFMILHGGFIAALYKTIGTEFGAQIVQRFVEEYDRLMMPNNVEPTGKKLSNLITFVAELYNFQVVGSTLIYDILRKLIEDLSEENAEILLRITRIAGSQLRQDDSASLKDIVSMLHISMERIGVQNLSIRTKFMIETIENLKNNKVKTGITTSTIRTEHTTAMKKTLGSISSAKIRTREPLGIGMDDIRKADNRGKWWLVGASVRDKEDDDPEPDSRRKKPTSNSIQDSEIDVEQVARDQGMNTEIRRAIFISIVTSHDNKEACMRLDKLPLKNKQRFEIPRVVVHCVGAEKKYYNTFYTKIARELCRDRDMRKAFSFTLWDIFRRLEDDENEDDLQADLRLDTTAIVYIAKMYGELVASDRQNILLLKHLDLTHGLPRLRMFAEVFLIMVFQKVKSSSKIRFIFEVVKEQPEMTASLQLFLKKVVRKTSLVPDPEEMAKVKSGCKMAESVLLNLMSGGVGREELADLL